MLRKPRSTPIRPPRARSPVAQTASNWSGANIEIANIAPDEGLSAPFNSWFTLFGQFFDHGLDLVNKGGNGTVFIPLLPDDPLYDADGSRQPIHGADARQLSIGR